MKRIFNRIALFFNRLSRRFFYFLASPSKWKFLAFFVFAIAVIVGLIVWKPDYAWNIINTAFGFFLGSIGVYFIGVLRRSTEDYNKVINDAEFIKKRNYDSSYAMSFRFNDKDIGDYFDCCYKNDGTIIEVIDDKEKMFELDGLIANSYFDIMKSHGGSYKHNETMVRLDHYKLDNGKIVLYTSRSTYFNHLVTNRAIDYFVQGHMTLRDIYEPGPFLTPLEKSKMSNHIGINAFFTIESKGKQFLLLPKRGKTSTISKGLVTSSIASRLVLSNPLSDNLSTQSNVPFEKQVQSLVCTKLDISEQEAKSIQTVFLGFGRNIYEGGKPQFYYWLKLTCLDEHFEKYCGDFKQRGKRNEQLDRDIGLMLIDLASLKYCNHDAFKASRMITFSRSKKVFFTVEKSFLANLYLFFENNKH